MKNGKYFCAWKSRSDRAGANRKDCGDRYRFMSSLRRQELSRAQSEDKSGEVIHIASLPLVAHGPRFAIANHERRLNARLIVLR